MKKTISVLLLLCMFVSLFAGMAYAEDGTNVPEAAEAEAQIAEETAAAEPETAPAEEADAAEEAAPAETVDRGSDVHRVFHSDFYIAADSANGIAAKIKVDYVPGGSIGKLYLPGKTDTKALCFSWDDDGLTVQLDGVQYESGTLPIPQPGETRTYKVTRGAALALVTIKTSKGSPAVEPLFLELDEKLGTIDAMNKDKDHETWCYGKVLFNNSTNYVGMKGRGNSTWDMAKKPYNITLYKNDDYAKKQKVTNFIDGVKSNKYCLLANYLDNSLMRNKIAMDLAARMGIGLETRFVDIWMNGEYLGNYLMTPKKDLWASDDGFMLENDHIPDDSAEQFQIDGMHDMLLKHNRINIEEIGDDAAEAGVDQAYIQAWFNEAFAALTDYETEDYQNYFDLDSWAKMFLMFEVTKTYDCYSGNILMRRDGLTENDKLIAGPAWDYDIALGRTLHKFLVGVSEPIQLNAEGWYNDSIGLFAVDQPVSLLQELGKHSSFMQAVAKVYRENLDAFEDMTANVDRQQALLRDSAMMNNVLWGTHSLSADYLVSPTGMRVLGTGKYNLNYRVTLTWNDYVANLREFAAKRVLWLTDHLYTEVPAGAIVVSEDGYSLQAVLTAGSANASYQWQRLDGEVWKDIAGAADAVYTPAAGSGEAQYRCVVTNAGPTICTTHGGSVENTAEAALEAVTFTAPEPVDEPAAEEPETPAASESPCSAVPDFIQNSWLFKFFGRFTIGWNTAVRGMTA